MKKPKMLSSRNDRPGSLASAKTLFGENSRYAVFAINTRFGHHHWMVTDAEQGDEITGRPLVIRQADSFEEAVAGYCPNCRDLVDLDLWSASENSCDNCYVDTILS